jgi:hypothetical protein
MSFHDAAAHFRLLSSRPRNGSPGHNPPDSPEMCPQLSKQFPAGVLLTSAGTSSAEIICLHVMRAGSAISTFRRPSVYRSAHTFRQDFHITL